MLPNVLKHSLDVLRVCRIREVREDTLVFGVRVHGEEEGFDEFFRCIGVVVLGGLFVVLELWGLKLILIQ